MGVIKKLITGSKTIDPNFISAAEDLAIDLPQAKLTGQQAKAYFKKNGAKDRELEALGLDGIFEQDKTTKQEILNKIDENRIEFESEINGGPGVGFDKAITFGTSDVSARDYFGDDGFLNEVDYITSDTAFNRSLAFDFIADQVFPDGLTGSELDLLSEIKDSFGKINFNHPFFDNFDVPPGLEDFAEGRLAFVDLPDELAFKMYDQVEKMVIDDYNMNPAQKLTMYVDGEPTDYELFKRAQDDEWSPNLGYSPPFIETEFSSLNRPESLNEAQVRLSSLAEEIGDVEAPENQVKWQNFSTVQGKNYLEERVRIKKMPAFDPDPQGFDFPEGYEVFRDKVHFPQDVNNIFHIRTSDHIHKDKSGKEKNILVIEELQSDWAQQGRERIDPFEGLTPDGREVLIGGFTSPTFRSSVLEKTKELKKKIEEIYGPDSGFADDPYRNDAFGIRVIKDDLSPESAPRIYGDVYKSIKTHQKFLNKNADKFEDSFLDYIADNIAGEGRSPSKFINTQSMQNLPDASREKTRKALLSIVNEIPEDIKKLGRQIMPTGTPSFTLSQVEPPPLGAIQDKQDLFDFILQKAYEPRQDLDGQTLFEFVSKPKIKQSTGLDSEQIVAANDYIAKDSDLMDQIARKRTEYNPAIADTPTWTNMAIKHIFKRAADEGYDGVAFVPGELQVKRWRDKGLETYYDRIIPKQIEKVFGKKKPDTERETMFLQDYEDGRNNDPSMGYVSSRAVIYDLDEELKNGKTISQKVSDGVTSFSAPVAGLGLAGLAALSPEESQAAEDMAAEVESMKAGRVNPDVAAFADAVSGGAQVLGEGIMDLLIEPAVEYGAGRIALGLGKSPEEITQTAKKAREKINYEVSSPTAKRYKDRILQGLGGLGQYLTGEGTERTMPLGVMRPGMGRPTTIETKKRDPLQAAFQDIYEPSAEALTEGIMALQYPFDESKEAQAAREASRDFVEVIQPL